eukprot:g47175.t1
MPNFPKPPGEEEALLGILDHLIYMGGPGQIVYRHSQELDADINRGMSSSLLPESGGIPVSRPKDPSSSSTCPVVDSAGRLLVAGGAAVGLGALCYYGLGMSNEIGAIEKAVGKFIDEAAEDGWASEIILRISWRNRTHSTVGCSDQQITSNHESYDEEFLPGVMGAVVAPMVLLGGPILMRAAWYTVGIVGGLSTVAMCAPSEKFLHIGGPLAVGLGLVFASSIGSMFLPPTSAFGAGLYSVAVYGGLVLFGMFLLYDTQKVIKRAEMYPVYSVRKFDPINAGGHIGSSGYCGPSWRMYRFGFGKFVLGLGWRCMGRCMGIYMDTLNIFIRVATILLSFKYVYCLYSVFDGYRQESTLETIVIRHRAMR